LVEAAKGGGHAPMKGDTAPEQVVTAEQVFDAPDL
jgi:hypothetical protein